MAAAPIKPVTASKMLQRRSTMDLLGGIRITKRSTNRGPRPQSELERSAARTWRTDGEPSPSSLQLMSPSEKQHLQIYISPMEKAPLSLRSPVDGSTDEVEQGGLGHVVDTMRRQHQFLEGLLLRNLDTTRRFPYILYAVFTTSQHGHCLTDTQWERELCEGLGANILTHLGSYEEMYTFIDPALPLLPKKPTNQNIAYIVTVFRSIGNRATLDQSWASWSGANFIAAHAPPELKLQRLSLHRMCVSGQEPEVAVSDEQSFSYVLICELGQALAHLCIAREFVDKLWSRECGYTSLYVLDSAF